MKAHFNQRNWCAHEIDAFHIPARKSIHRGGWRFHFVIRFVDDGFTSFIGFVGRSLLDSHAVIFGIYLVCEGRNNDSSFLLSLIRIEKYISTVDPLFVFE